MSQSVDQVPRDGLPINLQCHLGDTLDTRDGSDAFNLPPGLAVPDQIGDQRDQGTTKRLPRLLSEHAKEETHSVVAITAKHLTRTTPLSPRNGRT